jgi:hypothetical protein
VACKSCSAVLLQDTHSPGERDAPPRKKQWESTLYFAVQGPNKSNHYKVGPILNRRGIPSNLSVFASYRALHVLLSRDINVKLDMEVLVREVGRGGGVSVSVSWECILQGHCRVRSFSHKPGMLQCSICWQQRLTDTHKHPYKFSGPSKGALRQCSCCPKVWNDFNKRQLRCGWAC